MNTVIVWVLFVAGSPTVAYYNKDRCQVHAYEQTDNRVPAYCAQMALIGLPPK